MRILKLALFNQILNNYVNKKKIQDVQRRKNKKTQQKLKDTKKRKQKKKEEANNIKK